MALTAAGLKRDWVGVEFDLKEFPVSEEKMLAWAHAVGETDPRFTDPSHPEFRAHPGYTTQFHGHSTFPKDFPKLPGGFGIDGGKAVTVDRPIRAGDVLTGKSSIADVYEKTGRSGTMLFIVHRMTFFNQDGERVSVVDWRLIQRLKD